MLYEAIAYGLILGGSYVYHRWFEDRPKATPAKEIQLPRTDEGATIPLIYGRCRIRAPILAWAGNVGAQDIGADTPQLLYFWEALYILGIGFENGNGINRIHKMYAGDLRLPEWPGFEPLSNLTGDGNFEVDVRESYLSTEEVSSFVGIGAGGDVRGHLEFLNGNSAQQLVDPTFPHASTTMAGERMSAAVDPSLIPGYRGYMLAFLYHRETDPGQGWMIGGSPTPQSYGYEASSYPGVGLASQPGVEANPADVIYDMVRSRFGKLGIDSTAYVDYESFRAAAQTLFDEGHGYSMAIEATRDAREHIGAVLQQIDAVLYEDHVNDKIGIKLIRDDYDTATIRNINPHNCEGLYDYAAGGWTNLANKFRVVFSDRDNGYRDGSEPADSQGNAFGQDGLASEVVISYPAVCTRVLAKKLANRERDARSRPIAKCRVVVDRSFFRTRHGDPLTLTWPDYNISGMVFRVANVVRGTRASNKITLWLIQDVYDVYGGRITVRPPEAADPADTVLG